MSDRQRGALVWFRRDLRDHDHAALAGALADGAPVWCAFVLDREILDALPSRRDRRVEFIVESLRELDAALRTRGGGLIVRHGFARDEIPRLAAALGVATVHANRDYEPATRARDDAVAAALRAIDIAFSLHKDHVIRDGDEVLAASGKPFAVFTPYRNAWLKRLGVADVAPHDVETNAQALRPPPASLDVGIPSLESIGFEAGSLAASGVMPGMRGGAAQFARFRERIEDYDERRDDPLQEGSSQLSVHLRFGTVSIRELVAFAHTRSLQPGGAGAAAWLSELAWREFFSQILWHFPHVVDAPFDRSRGALRFREDDGAFTAWRDGRTGYPFVDAGMRQLASTGTMSNRVRMVAASFLVKHLLVDWRRGERHFADQLLDYDLASNNGNWQWVASTGCDAQPWFRIFNPVTQSERFDPEGTFIRRYVPELTNLDANEIHAPWKVDDATLRSKGVRPGIDYPRPIVDHAAARERALAMYSAARKG